MTDELRALIEKARHAQRTAEEQAEHRISFVYGNIHYEDERITHEQVIRWASLLSEEKPTSKVMAGS